MSHLPDQLLWLADAPLFIDRGHVACFHDAVVQPDGQIVAETRELSKEQIGKINAKLKAEISAEPGALASLLAPVFAFFKPKVSIGGEVEGGGEFKSSSKTATQSRPIITPQRLLVELTVHYLIDQTDRLLLVSDPTSDEWRKPDVVSAVPRSLAFLDLQPGTKLIPTAAEFSNGAIEPLFDKLKGQDGSEPPNYPEEPVDGKSLSDLRKEYWQWFNEKFNEADAMRIVEKAASQHGRIHWIDYRLPLTNDGDTLHLHVCPAGECDTGVFAYNLIKRGFKHGIRVVGTLKSEPDMNVLALFEK